MGIDLTQATDTSFKPTLYDVHKVLKEEVVGEHEAGMSLFTNWICSERDVMMAGPRASGKTFVTDHVRGFVGDLQSKEGGQSYVLTAGSDKSAYYQAEEINKSKYIVVLELNKIPKELVETLKDWGEGKDSKYRTTLMTGGMRRTKELILNRKPFVFCLADEDETKVDSQLASRLTVIRTDNSITQNRNVMNHQARLARLPDNPLRVDIASKTKLREHIMTLPLFRKYIWKNPASDMFTESVPPFFTDSRRDFQKYLDNVSGICRFHWKDRLKSVIKDNKEAYFITPQDMWLNHVIYGATVISSALKCNNIEREMMSILQVSETALKRADVQMELKKRGSTLSAGMCTRHLNSLTDLGYLEKDVAKENKKWVEYNVGKMFDEFSFTIDWKKVVDYSSSSMEELYPDVSEEYFTRYCKEPLVQHPFKDEMVNLLDIKVEAIKTYLGQAKIGTQYEVKSEVIK